MDKEDFIRRIEIIKPRLYRTSYLYLGNEADAMNTVDETVYKALKHLKKLRQPIYFETWVTRILINECKREWKRNRNSMDFRKEKHHSQDEAANFNYDSLPLKEAILKLPDDLKIIIILRFFSGYTLQETAQSMDIPQGTVSTKQSRALKLLRLELSEED